MRGGGESGGGRPTPQLQPAGNTNIMGSASNNTNNSPSNPPTTTEDIDVDFLPQIYDIIKR